MRLEGVALACIRGGREVFAGLEFSVGGGEALLVTGQEWRGQVHAAAAGCRAGQAGRRAALAVRRRPRTQHRRAGALPRPSGCAEAVAHSRRKSPVLDASDLASAKPAEGAEYTALAAVGLGALTELPAAYLSAGQRRRLSIARLLAVKRPIWLLDEPTSALDRDAQDMLAGLMREHLSGGGIIAAATHGPIGLDRARELQLGAIRPGIRPGIRP